MARSYRRLKRLTPRHRQRLARVFMTAVLFRAVYPAMATAFASLGIAVVVTRVLWPGIDTNAWPFIVTVMLLTFAVGIAAWAVANAFLIRWLIRYRSGRHGRAVALGDVLRPSDVHASFLRRIALTAYGISSTDLETLREDATR